MRRFCDFQTPCILLKNKKCKKFVISRNYWLINKRLKKVREIQITQILIVSIAISYIFCALDFTFVNNEFWTLVFLWIAASLKAKGKWLFFGLITFGYGLLQGICDVGYHAMSSCLLFAPFFSLFLGTLKEDCKMLQFLGTKCTHEKIWPWKREQQKLTNIGNILAKHKKIMWQTIGFKTNGFPIFVPNEPFFSVFSNIWIFPPKINIQ